MFNLVKTHEKSHIMADLCIAIKQLLVNLHDISCKWHL